MLGGSATVSETGVLSKVIIIIGMEWQGQNIKHSKTTLWINVMLLKTWDLFITVCGFGSGLVFHLQIARLLFQIRTNWCKKDLAICMRHVFIVSIRSPGPWYLECCVLKLRRLLKLFLSPTHILISSTFNNILLLIIKSLLLQVEICWVLFGVAGLL